MKLVTYKKKIFLLSQIWYATEIGKWIKKQKLKADILFFHGVNQEELDGIVDVKKGIFSTFYTLKGDLSLSEDEISGQIQKRIQSEIRRSHKEDVEVICYDSKALKGQKNIIDSFAEMYEEMYREKGVHQTLNRALFDEYVGADMVYMTSAWYNGVPIVFHTYIIDDQNARLLHSVSEFRAVEADANSIGRANKRLHMDDMVLFKEMGIISYDWGGISNPETPNGIDQFKLKFGGTVETNYNVLYPNTLFGKYIIRGMKFLKKQI